MGHHHLRLDDAGTRGETMFLKDNPPPEKHVVALNGGLNGDVSITTYN